MIAVGDLTVLICDDDAENRRLLRRMLRRIGCPRVSEAENGRDCLEQVARERFDVLFLDIRMPELSGFDVCRTLRSSESGQRMRIVACTAYASLAEQRRFWGAGFDSVLTKPFLVDDLRRAIGASCNGSVVS